MDSLFFGNFLYDWFGPNIGLQIENFGIKLLIGLAVIVFGFLIVGQVASAFRRLLQKRGVDDTLAPFLTSTLKYILYALVVIIAASTMGLEMTSIVGVIASLGLAIGLALQGALSNFAGGVLIMILKPFKKGDFITAQGETGTVTDINIVSTTLLTLDFKTVFIPNGPLAGGNITNYTREEIRRCDLTFGIGYGDDIEKARKIILDLANGFDKVLDGTKAPDGPFVRVVELADSSVNFTCRLWTRNEHYWDVYFYMTEEVKKTFDKEGVSIPYPQMDIHLDPAPGEGS